MACEGRGARRRAAVPAGPRPTGGGGGRHRGQGVPAALGRTAAARELAQGGRAACARGGRAFHGGAAAIRRRGGDSAAAAADLGGEKVREREEVAGELT